MKLLYKTKNGQHPQGLSRVYFCAHPEEYREHLDPITRDVHEHTNCAVWYKEDPSTAVDHLLLDDMNLIIVAVTYRFLTTPNPARDEEIAYALKQNIPLLPILFAPGLETEYASVFGNRQFLARFQANNGALDYVHKLGLSLSRSTVSHTQTEKILSAFETTFFLSYRKKDRLAALRLMRRIHQSEDLRHIAIWYDEYLSVGEDFNRSIEAELEKSLLFILAVTRNMVDEESYVSRCEYPMAQQQNKAVLPILLDSIDQQLLRERFPALPDTLEEDQQAIERILKDFLAENGIEIRNDPHTIYLLALAYFFGVYVEKDAALGIDYLKRSVKMGNPQAAKMLAEIYANGQHVKGDLSLAFKYQKIWLKHTRKTYREALLSTDVDAFAEAMLDTAELYRRMGRMNKGKSLLARCYQLYSDMTYERKDDYHRTYLTLLTHSDFHKQELLDMGKTNMVENVPEPPIGCSPYVEAAAVLRDLLRAAKESTDYPAIRNRCYEQLLRLPLDEAECFLIHPAAQRKLMIAYSLLGTTINEHYPHGDSHDYFARAQQLAEPDETVSHTEIARIFGRPNIPSIRNDSLDVRVFLSAWKQIHRTNRLAKKEKPAFEEGVALPLKAVKPYADRMGARAIFMEIASMSDFNMLLDDLTMDWMQNGKILCANDEEKAEAVRLYEKCACSFLFDGNFPLPYIELCQDLHDRSPSDSVYLQKIGFAYLSRANYLTHRLTSTLYSEYGEESNTLPQDSDLCEEILLPCETVPKEPINPDPTTTTLTTAIECAQKAYDSYKTCMQIHHHSDVTMEYCACCHLLGNLLVQNGQADQALKYLDEAFSTYESIILNRHQASLEQILELSLIKAAEEENPVPHIERATDLITHIQNEERAILMSARLHKIQSDLFFRERNPEFTLHFAHRTRKEYEELFEIDPERYRDGLCMARLWVMERLTDSPEDQEQHRRLYEDNCAILEPIVQENPTVQSTLLLAETYLSVVFREIHTQNTCEAALKALELIKPRQRFRAHPRYYDIFFKAHVYTVAFDWKNKRYGKAIFKFTRLFFTLLPDLYRHIFSDISISI